MGMGSITTSELFVFGIFILLLNFFVAISLMLITGGCGGGRVCAENVLK